MGNYLDEPAATGTVAAGTEAVAEVVAEVIAEVGETRLGVVVGNIDDERVAFPMAARIAIPELDLLRQVWLAVQVDDAGAGIEEKHDVAGKLPDLIAMAGE
jgi:hypothetical protein